MELVAIFVDDETKKGLYSIKYPKKNNEFDLLFENWNDILYVSDYCVKNKFYIQSDYFRERSMWIDEVIQQIGIETEILENQIKNYAKEGFKANGDNLQMLFKPLRNKETNLPVLQETKAKVIRNRKITRPILRVYGLRIDVNTIIITGGAIKLTKEMHEHSDTEDELRKIKEAKVFLKKNGIEYQEDILNLYADES